MQTRSLAAAGGALVALGLSLAMLRSVHAQTPAALTLCRADPIPAFDAETDRQPHVPMERVAMIDVPQAPEPEPTLGHETRADLALRNGNADCCADELAAILAAWSAEDAGAALIWLSQHPFPDTSRLMQAIGEGLADDPTGPTFALAYLAQDHGNGSLLAGPLVRELAARNESASAVRVARTAPEGWSHEWATVAFANLAYEDAATALEALAGIDDPALQRTTATAIIAGWAERDPAELAQHLGAFGSADLRAEALVTAIDRWTRLDPAAAAEFAASLPRG